MPANLENSAVATGLESSVFIPIPKKGNAKECSNYCTTALISHVSKVMLKILQARLQQYMNWEIPDVKVEFRKGRGTRDRIANILWIIEKVREFQKNIYFCSNWLSQSFLLCGAQQTVKKSFKPGFNNMWTEKFRLYKLDLEKVEEGERKLSTRQITEKAREFQDICFCFIDYMKAFDCVDHNKLWKILKELGIHRTLYLPPEKPICKTRSNT